MAADLSAAFTRAVVENLPTALLVYDRFHAVKLFHGNSLGPASRVASRRG